MGHSLLPMLVQQGFHVRALSRHPERSPWLRELGFEIVQGDVLDGAKLKAAVAGKDIVYANLTGADSARI